MVALLDPSTPLLLQEERRFAPTGGRPSRSRSEVICALHRTITDPDADAAMVKRAKTQLLRIINAPAGAPRFVVPAFGLRPSGASAVGAGFLRRIDSLS